MRRLFCLFVSSLTFPIVYHLEMFGEEILRSGNFLVPTPRWAM